MSLFKSLIVAGLSVPFLIAGAAASPEQTAADAPGAAASTPSETGGEVAAPSENSSESGAQGSEEKVAENDEDKVVCKYIARTGTRFGEKICATRKQWEQMRKDSQESVADAQRRASEYRTPN